MSLRERVIPHRMWLLLIAGLILCQVFGHYFGLYFHLPSILWGVLWVLAWVKWAEARRGHREAEERRARVLMMNRLYFDQRLYKNGGVSR